VAMMTDIRGTVVASSDSPAEHKRLFEKILDSEILLSIKEKQWNILKKLLREILPVEIDVSRLVENIQNYHKE